jgi:hypothetical protein
MGPYIDGYTQVISPKGVCRFDRYAWDGDLVVEVLPTCYLGIMDSPSMPVRGMGISFEGNYGDRVAPEGQ